MTEQQQPALPQPTSADSARQLVLMKHGRRYIFRYAPGEEVKLLDELVCLAGDPTSELDWFDAAVLSHQMGQRFGHVFENLLKP